MEMLIYYYYCPLTVEHKSGTAILVKPTCSLTAFACFLWLRFAGVDDQALGVGADGVLRLICTELCLRIDDLEDV